MRDYRSYTYPRRQRTPRAVWLLLIICALIAMRMDYAAQRDCNGNQTCIATVTP